MAFFIGAVLGEHAAQINLAGLGRAVGLLAASPRSSSGTIGTLVPSALTYRIGASQVPG
jgi:hypothetical protein